MGGALDERGVWMARTHWVASRRHGVVRRALAAALVLAMTVGQVPTAAFAEILGVEAAAVEPFAGGAQLSAGEQNQNIASEQNPVESAEAAGTTKEEAGAIDLEDVRAIEVSIAVIGPDANDVDVQWAGNAKMALKAETPAVDAVEASEPAVDAAKSVTAPVGDAVAGPTAADATEALFKEAGLEADCGVGDYGFYLNTITSPYTGERLGWDQATGKYWQLFVNGKASDVGASGVMLKAGDAIVWAYSAFGSSAPEVPSVVPQPDAPRPDWDSAWPGYASGSNTAAPIPTGEVKETWVSQIKDSADWATNVSDPIYVGDFVYIAAGSKLLQLNTKTGETVREGALVAPINSIARMVYVDGRIIVPLAGGRLQALTADCLITMWMTPELPANAQGGPQQSLTTLALGDGRVYYGTAAADWKTSYGGFLTCVDVQTGKVMWSHENSEKGYYWSGAALVGSHVVIGDDSGAVVARDAKTGAEASCVDAGAPVRSTIMTGDCGKTLFAVSSDGVLHRLSIDDSGSLSETGKVKFAKSSTCAPTISNGKVFVGGVANLGDSGKSCAALSVIDADTLTVITEVTSADGVELSGLGMDIKGVPVVAARNDGVYVYFTANAMPGGVYRYRLGDTDAHLIYVPAADRQNYCMASITVGPDGTLYYVNDSGALFAIKGVGGQEPGGSDGGNGGETGGNDGGNGGGETGNGGGETGGNGGEQGGSDGQGGDPQSGNENRPGNNGTDSGAGNNSSGTGSTGSGNGTGDGAGEGSNSGSDPSSATGAVAAGKKPLKPQDGQKKDAEKTGEKKSDSKKGAKDEKGDSPSKSGTSSVEDSSAANRTAGLSASVGRGPLATILPVLGIAVGAIGLGAIAFWVFRRRV